MNFRFSVLRELPGEWCHVVTFVLELSIIKAMWNDWLKWNWNDGFLMDWNAVINSVMIFLEGIGCIWKWGFSERLQRLHEWQNKEIFKKIEEKPQISWSIPPLSSVVKLTTRNLNHFFSKFPSIQKVKHH